MSCASLVDRGCDHVVVRVIHLIAILLFAGIVALVLHLAALY